MEGIAVNELATAFARSCGFVGTIRGVMVVVGIEGETGLTVALSDDQIEGVRRRVGELAGDADG